MGNYGSNAAGIVVITRKFLAMLFSGLGLSFPFFHKFLDQFNVVLETAVLGDERVEEMEPVGIAGEGTLSLLQLRLELSDRGRWNGGCGWFGGGLGRHNRRKGLGVWRKGCGLEGSSDTMIPLWRNSMITDHSTAESVMDLVHRAVQRVELSTSLPTFLQFTLEAAEDVVESETALTGWTHATTHTTHADKPLRLHRRATLAANSGSLTTKVECITRSGGGGHVLVVTREGVTRWVLSELLLFRMGGGLGVLLVENAEDAGGNLVVDDGLVVFADDIDAELLIKCGCVVKLGMTSEVGGNDLQRCPRTLTRMVRILDLHH